MTYAFAVRCWANDKKTLLGDRGPGYSNGTVCMAEFTGKFTAPVQINDYTYSFQLNSFTYTTPTGTTQIVNGQRHIYTDARGISGDNKTFYLYTPDTPRSKLPDGFLIWVTWKPYPKEKLGYYGLYNVEAGWAEN